GALDVKPSGASRPTAMFDDFVKYEWTRRKMSKGLSCAFNTSTVCPGSTVTVYAGIRRTGIRETFVELANVWVTGTVSGTVCCGSICSLRVATRMDGGSGVSNWLMESCGGWASSVIENCRPCSGSPVLAANCLPTIHTSGGPWNGHSSPLRQ